MRDCILLALTLGAVACGVSHGEETLPYRLAVVGEGIEVRSGSGPTSYVTGYLAEGSSIEVYRRDGGGWLGIRPPADSFSWVRADQIEDTDQPGVARVLRDDTVCRVGSRVEEVEEHVGQVYLQKDELVELVDLPPVDTETARRLEEQGWRRIAPPAGEFRWVQAGDLARARKSLAKASIRAAKATATDAGEPSTVRPAGHWEENAAGPKTLSTAQVVQAVAIGATENEEDNHARRAPADPPLAATDAGVESPAFEELASEAEKPVDQTSRWVSRVGVPVGELLDVEMRLAMTAAREVHGWRLQPLRDRVESTLPRLKTDAEREQAKRLLNRIAEYEELQNRFAQAGEIAPLTETQPLRGPTGVVAPPDWEDSLLSRFDGSGWLVPVHSTRRVAPPYALLDDEGEVLQYVTPSPGLNLHRYLRKRVGLYGQRGHTASLNKPVITAERVVDLRRHLR